MGAFFEGIALVGLGLLGFFGVIVLIIVVFGNRVRKEWEFEAEFREPTGAYGEFDIESSMIEKKDTEFRLRATLEIRHKMIEPDMEIQVLLDNRLVLEGVSTKSGRAFLYSENLPVSSLSVETGQRCVVTVGGVEVATANMVAD